MNTVSAYLHKGLFVIYLVLFFLTPFLFYPLTHYFPIPWNVFGIDPQTYELFEFNKMYFVYGLSVLTAVLWAIRCIEEKRVIFRKTFLDYPLALFLLSQILSTIFSIDIHTSIWGYYSRFHGGLLSSFSYTLLYWALVSNFYEKKYAHRFLNAALISGTVVSWYGIAQHYGIDKDFWVQNVQARVFSSLGQPNWLAAFLVALIPLSVAYYLFESRWFFKVYYLIVTISLFISFLFTASRSGLLALVIGMGVLAALIVGQRFTSVVRYFQIGVGFIILASVYTFVYYKFPHYAIIASHVAVLLVSVMLIYFSAVSNRIWTGVLFGILVITGILYSSADAFRLGVTGSVPGAPAAVVKAIPQDAGGTETGAIRFIVWKGAWEIFKHYPILGSGVESFAYSFYQYRPVELLRTSEWDFLYNKAHNEYFNILATTGLFGLLVYGYLVFSTVREGWLGLRSVAGNEFTAPVEKLDVKVDRARKQLKSDLVQHAHLENPYYSFLVGSALLAGFVTILITNFFGFSVVNVALFFFLFPAFISLLAHRERFSVGILRRLRILVQKVTPREKALDWLHIGLYGLLVFVGMYMLSTLFNYWFADIHFASARLLNKQGHIGQAHKEFSTVLSLRQDEPYYYSELGWTEGEIVYSLMKDNDASSSADIVPIAEINAKTAVEMSPDNVLYWKKLADTYYNLTFFDINEYKDDLKKAADRTRTLAPTDVSTLLVLSNYYQRLEDFDTAIKIVSQSTQWKPDLAEAWNRLGEIYFARYQKTKNETDKNKANEYRFKAAQLDPASEDYKKGFE